jgi:hypothetical protein
LTSAEDRPSLVAVHDEELGTGLSQFDPDDSFSSGLEELVEVADLPPFAHFGVPRIFGVDGPWVDESTLRIPPDRFSLQT